MNNDDERDYAEEDANAALLREEDGDAAVRAEALRTAIALTEAGYLATTLDATGASIVIGSDAAGRLLYEATRDDLHDDNDCPDITGIRAERDALAAELKQGTNDALALAAEENDRLAAEVERLREWNWGVGAERDAARAEAEELRAERDDLSTRALKQAAEIGLLRAELAEASLVCVSCEHLWAQHGNWGCTADNDLGDCLCAVTSSTTVLPAPVVADDTSREASGAEFLNSVGFAGQTNWRDITPEATS